MLPYFILGILFITLGIPILEALSSAVSAWGQYVVYTFAFKIYTIKKKMGVDQEDQEEDEDKIIGFTSAVGDIIPSEEQFDQDQEE